MPKKPLKKAAAAVVQMFTAWSYSRYKDHRTCARMAHWKHVLKKPQRPKSPAMQRGGDIHKEGERYLLGLLRAVPKSYAAFKKELAELKKLRAAAEGKWAMDVKWEPCEFFDMPRAWCRVILDAHARAQKKGRARVVDFKTGKVYPDDNDEQMELYALSTFQHYDDDVVEVDVELWYLDQPRGKIDLGGGKHITNPHVVTYHRKQLGALQKKWRAKVIPIMTDKRFVPSPGRHCSWCDFSKRHGGECPH